VGKGHGRVERRTATTTTALNADLRDWPALAQVGRERRVNGASSVEVADCITSLNRGRANAARLLALIRRHWGIENEVHHVRDVSLGEDACRVRTGSRPVMLAALRNTALHLLAGVEATSRAAAMRRFAAHPHEALRLIKR
jgi:hypothetical protein